MDKIGNKLDNVVNAILSNLPHPLYRDIYNHKVIYTKEKEAVFMSCRFITPNKKYYIFTLLVQLKEDKPVVQVIISTLLENRFFFKQLKTFKKEITHNETIPFILNDPHVKSYCKNEKHFPDGLLKDQYEKIKEEVLTFINQLE